MTANPSEAAHPEALARLIDVHRALPLSRVWGGGTKASSDGQHFFAGGRGEAIADINARQGNEPGVSFYTHISDQYGPFHTKVIAATAGEAPHVLDGLLYHQSGLAIEEHTVDTGGASDHVFGLMPFFGYRFAPRLRDLKERRLHLPPGMAPSRQAAARRRTLSPRRETSAGRGPPPQMVRARRETAQPRPRALARPPQRLPACSTTTPGDDSVLHRGTQPIPTIPQGEAGA